MMHTGSIILYEVEDPLNSQENLWFKSFANLSVPSPAQENCGSA